MFIKSIELSNFKGFIGNNHQISFKIPDGETAGSGLNIFVGENNSGKSSIFEAINFLRNGIKEDDTHRIKSKLADGSQPNEACVELTFYGDIQNTILCFAPESKREPFNKALDGQIELKFKRNTKSCKKLELWDNRSQQYSNPAGIDASFKTLFETNFIWADTNPSDEATFGSTTLCGLLLKEIAKAHVSSDEYKKFQDSFNNLFNTETSSLRQQISVIEKKVQRIFSEQFGQADIRFKFDELKIDSFFKNTSIFINDGIDIPMSEKGNGMQRSIALALLQVYAEESAHDPEQDQTKPFYLFIDEPELCLHPKGQTKLLEALLKISKTKQVFLTTHSPYFLVTPSLKNIGLFIFKKDGISNIAEDASLKPIFIWGPTWGEINFKAYNLPTIELHNELYGYLQNISSMRDSKEFDSWLMAHDLPTCKQWIKDQNVSKTMNVTLQTFIRHHIHHPENKLNPIYTENELDQSIREMIDLLKSLPI